MGVTGKREGGKIRILRPQNEGSAGDSVRREEEEKEWVVLGNGQRCCGDNE